MANTSLREQFVAALRKLARASAVADVARFFRADPDGNSGGNKLLGVSIDRIFPVAKRHSATPLADIESLLESPYYELRMGTERKALYDLYLRRHDRINNWDLVDRAAPHVVGGYLADKPRRILYQLARSKNPWERRTAIVSTWYFIRQGDLDDTFRIAALLVRDEHDLVQKAVGSWLREAGKKDKKRLLAFLKVHAKIMPRPALRYAIEKLTPAERARFA